MLFLGSFWQFVSLFLICSSFFQFSSLFSVEIDGIHYVWSIPHIYIYIYIYEA